MLWRVWIVLQNSTPTPPTTTRNRPEHAPILISINNLIGLFGSTVIELSIFSAFSRAYLCADYTLCIVTTAYAVGTMVTGIGWSNWRRVTVVAGRAKEPRETYLYNDCPGFQPGSGKSGLMWGKHVRNGGCNWGISRSQNLGEEELYHHQNGPSKRSIRE